MKKLLFISLLLLVLVGCESSAAKAAQKADAASKQAMVNEQAIQAMNSTITTLNTTMTTIKNEMTQITQSMTKSISAQFENFKGEYKQTQKNSTNSTWMILGLALIGCGFLLGLLILLGLWLGDNGIIGRGKS